MQAISLHPTYLTLYINASEIHTYSAKSLSPCVVMKITHNHREFIITSTSCLLILLWVYTALSKLMQLKISIAFLKKSPFSPIAQQIAVLLPLAELAIAIALIIPSTKFSALRASLMLLVTFTLYIFYMLAFYPSRPCNCGGVINSLSWEQHIAFNLFFIIITSLSIKWFKHKRVDQPGQAEHLHPK